MQFFNIFEEFEKIFNFKNYYPYFNYEKFKQRIFEMQGNQNLKNKKGPFKILVNNIFRTGRNPTIKLDRDSNINRRMSRLLTPIRITGNHNSMMMESSFIQDNDR